MHAGNETREALLFFKSLLSCSGGVSGLMLLPMIFLAVLGALLIGIGLT
jgi:hypothetical protein